MPTIKQVQERLIKVPFRVGDRGEIAFVTDPISMAAQEIRTIVFTYIGERVMRPGFGSPVQLSLFGPIREEEDLMMTQLNEALNQQCTLSSIQSTIVKLGDAVNLGEIEVEIEFVPLSFTTIHTTTVTVSG